MNDVEKVNLRSARQWLSGEVELRMPKAWLVIGAAAVLGLLLIAFD